MIKNLTILSFIFGTFTLIAQNGSVDQLSKAQEIRKKYIGGDIPAGQYAASKSLYVDPFIGTGGHGHTFPGATAPFGMMQLSPDTRYEGWDGCGGYHYSDSVIYGFSHTHLSGTGVPDYCDLLLVPQSGTPKTTPGYKDPKGYGDLFSHDQENASPGFYEVRLLNQQINVRLTTSKRAGMHEYTFLNKKGKKFILIDLDHRDRLLSQGMKIHSKHTISGHRVSEAWASNQHFYFQLELSVPFEKSRIVDKDGQHKLLLTFPSETDKILVKVGMSAVSEDGAKNNLITEITDWDFNALRAETVKAWDIELGKIDFQSPDKKTMINFYSALYHTFIQPNIFNDVSGEYRGRDNKIHKISDGEEQYTVFSLWDTYRATHPLYTLIQQKRTNSFIHTFLRQYDQGGDLPVWELAGNETECMIGYHSASVIADAYNKGIRDFDAEKALNAMVATSNFDELGKRFFRNNGFISSGDEPESVSKTLEYAYDDFCIAKMATDLGKMDVYQKYYKSALNFINVHDPKTGFMRARRNGLWYSPFDPSEVNFNYTEANSWQYSLYAPHAIDVLSEMMGGKDSLEHWLDRLFTTEMELSGRHQVDITGLIGQYAHGNEPSHHMAYLYNYTNASHKTSKYVDQIFKEIYNNTPDGLSGNEDCGQMSAWYVLSSMGLYQVTPGHAWYDFGRPLMNEVTLHLENGKNLKIRALNNNSENMYIQSITWNGKPWLMNEIAHSTIWEGGELVFTMGAKPSPEKRTCSYSAMAKTNLIQFSFVPSPYFTNEQRIFEETVDVQLDHLKAFNHEEISLQYRFLTDTTKVFTYSKPISLDKTTVIEARQVNAVGPAFDGAMPSVTVNFSPWVKAEFIKRDKNVSLELKSTYSPQYASAGPATLIDAVHGTKEFRTGDWQGYNAQDLVTEVKFTEPRILKEVGISCLQDMKSWIFFPSSIEIEISYDGVVFEKLPTILSNKPYVSNAQSPESIPSFSSYVGPTTAEFYRQTRSVRPIAAFRVIAKNYGKCPAWHLGAGNDTWLFSDELIFR
jgi:predicted alpha-1,2-mannosidase